MTTGKTYEAPDWRALAEDALDLWQTHLTSLANDPRAKDEMAKMVAPMNQMFADWAGMVQSAQDKMRQPSPAGSQDTDHDPASSPDASAASGASAGGGASNSDGAAAAASTTAPTTDLSGPASSSGTGDAGHSVRAGASGDAAVTAGDRDMAQLAVRLATLERRFQTLETLVASMATKEIAREQQRSAEARRARREGAETASEPTT